jgi:hypothetical protein
MGRLGRKHQITVWTGRKLLPYALDRLTWNPQHTRNEQNVYCYCGGHRETPCVQCHSCQQWFHTDCMKVGVIATHTRTRAYRWRKLRPHLPTSFPLGPSRSVLLSGGDEMHTGAGGPGAERAAVPAQLPVLLLGLRLRRGGVQAHLRHMAAVHPGRFLPHDVAHTP